MHPLPPHVEALLQAVLMDTASSRHTCPEALLPYLLGVLGLFSVFCAGMGVRSFRGNRPSGQLL